MQALFVAWYNFGREHEALKCKTPAVASQLTDHVWTIKERIEKEAEAQFDDNVDAIGVYLLRLDSMLRCGSAGKCD